MKINPNIDNIETFVTDLMAAIGPDRLERNVRLAPFTTFKIGGPADFFVEATTCDEIVLSIECARSHEVPFFLLGVGANILVGDAGFRGLVIRNCADQISFDHTKNLLTADSGAIVFPDIVQACVTHELSGFEHFAGIPSTIGGALWQNLHFLSPPPERERTVFIEEFLECATILNVSGEQKVVDLEYFQFGYDYSTLHDTGDIVLNATFQLSPKPRAVLESIIAANLEWRESRHPPLDTEPSAGSIFKKIEGIGAGRLIDTAGLKGTRIGGAEVTRRHANILINRGGATASDVIALIEHIQTTVAKDSGYHLEAEISLIGDFLPMPSDSVIVHG